MNRAKPINILLHAMLSLLLLLATLSGTLAQSDRSKELQSYIKSMKDQMRRTRGVRSTGTRPLISKMERLPAWVTRREFQQTGRAPGDQNVPRQTILLTRANVAQQNSLQPATAQDFSPYWTSDEKFIFFASNRVDASTGAGTNPRADGIYNIFRMFPDGTGLFQVTTGNINTIEPAISQDGNRMAYVADADGKSIDASGYPSKGYNLYVIDLTTAGAKPTALTSTNPQNILFTDVRHPTWFPNGNLICFTAQRGANQPYHLYLVSVDTGRITQLTDGTATEISPFWSPDARPIAFQSNASAYGTTGPNGSVATGSLLATTNIWTINPNIFKPNPKRITGTGLTLNGVAVTPPTGLSPNASYRSPSWSSLRADPLGLVPAQQQLAFSSNRGAANSDPASNKYAIYFMDANVGADASVTGTFQVTTPESQGNTPKTLVTSTPDPTIDPGEPSSSASAALQFSQYNSDMPAWPQFLSSYRIAFTSDRGAVGQYNIWASTILDLNAPAILRYDLPNNQIVGVYRDTDPQLTGPNSSTYAGYSRELSAGEVARFRVRLADYETGIQEAYLQIKNPSSASSSVGGSADGQEHKIFFAGPGFLDQNVSVINAPYELDYQAINANNSTVQFKGVGAANFPVGNKFIPGFDDSAAFSGNLPANAPDPFWLRIWDDGPVSLGGHEPEGETANDGVYTATWTTPASLPSDWFLDVIVRDRAINPYDTTRQVNWKIYDNIWGFTTQPFRGDGNVLYVNDYDCGQKFFLSRFGAGTGFFNITLFPTESWMTEYSSSLFPSFISTGTGPLQPLGNVQMPLGEFSYADGLTNDGTNIPVTGRYAQWRILARGPVPDSVLSQYSARVEQQPADVIGGTGPRSVVVAERCIIWHTPYTGNLFVGSGTLEDPDTQRRLTTFVNNGGRIFVNGQDIAYALTVGTVDGANPFLNNILNVNYKGDFFADTPITLRRDKPGSTSGTIRGEGGSPISTQTWFDRPLTGGYHIYEQIPTGQPPYDPPSNGQIYVGTPISGSPIREFGCPNQSSMDLVDWLPLPNPRTAAQTAINIDGYYGGDTTLPALFWRSGPNNSKIVFSPIGFEGINPESFAPTGGTGRRLKNRRVQLIHNVLDYLRTGRIIGFARDINGSLPAANVFIRAVAPRISTVDGSVITTTVATTYSQSDGSYVLNGLPADGFYIIEAAQPGFVTTKTQAQLFHGAYQGRVDMFLTRAQPGSINGKVIKQKQATTDPDVPVPGAIVRAVSLADLNTDGTLKTGAIEYYATSQIDGTYSINNVPSSDTIRYRVRINLGSASEEGSIIKLGYAGSDPPSYGGTETNAKASVLVPNSQGVGGIDFQLIPRPGRILGRVTGVDSSNNPLGGVGGATVTATRAGSSTSVTTTTTSGDPSNSTTGTYTLANLTPGTYTVIVTSPGYNASASRSVVVVSDVDASPIDFVLTAIPPGRIRGLVATRQGAAVSGTTIRVYKTATTTDKSAANLLATTNTGTVQSDGTNYLISNVPAGATVYVTAQKAGYNGNTETDAVSVNVQSNPGNQTSLDARADFTINPLYSFPTGPGTISLVSAPNDYTAAPLNRVTAVLGVDPADVTNGNFKFLTWNTRGSVYIPYATSPAETFHRGVGYFLENANSSATMSITDAGVAADFTKPFDIILEPGWNMIGDPFSFPINFLSLQVQPVDNSNNAVGGSVDVITAQSQQLLGGALWTYDSGRYQFAYTLDPYRGYWIRAFTRLKLTVTPAARQDRSAKRNANSRAAMFGNVQGTGWSLNLSAEANGVTRSAPGTIGVQTAATDGYDRFKLESPPAVGKQNVTLTFNHDDWGNKSGKYSMDVRSSAKTSQSWSMTVTSNVANTPVTLSWPDVATVPGKYELYLVDTDTQARINLRTRGSVVIPSTNGTLTKRYQLEVRRASRQQLQLTDISARVNQSAGRSATSVGIAYTLTADATVQVNILQNGRRIRTVEPNRSRAAGTSELTWDLKNEQGQVIAGNTYSIEVRATDNNGRMVRRVAPLIITR